MTTSSSATIVPRSYTGRDFDTAVAALVQFIKTTRPDVWSDFYQSNLGSALIDLMAYTLDVASYAQDASVLETFLSTCKRYESALFFARSVGYVPRPATAATATLRSVSVPDSVVAYGGTVLKGTQIRGKNGLVYEVTEDVTITPGNGIIRLNVHEGASRTQTVSTQATRNITVATGDTGVAADSWQVFVGPTNDPDNQWSQVDSVLVVDSGDEVYDVSFDLDGRAIFRFGDGVSGAIPDQDITVNYRICSGATGNAPARSISGQIPVYLLSPGTGSVQVSFENYEASVVGAGSSALTTGDYLGPCVASATQSFILSFSPSQPATVTLTISLAGGQVIVLRDTGAGVFAINSSNATQNLTASSITYSSGSIVLQFDNPLPAGGSVIADYYYVTVGDPTQVSIVGAATGGADRETVEEMRRNIPAFIRSSNRLVTLADYKSAVRSIAGVALSEASVWVSGYTGNVVRLFVWGTESVTIRSQESNGDSAAALYQRYSQVSDTVTSRVQSIVRERSLLTVGTIVLRPEMLWLDLYFGNIRYDKRLSAQTVREGIMAALVAYFQQATGFAIRLSELYSAVRAARGVLFFEIARITTGTRSIDSPAEAQGGTTLSNTVSGTLLNTIISPTTAIITIEQATSRVVCQDNGAGQFTVVSGTLSITSSSIDYTTGAWTITFGSTLAAGYPITAQYSDVVEDFRHDQVVEIGGDEKSGDYWPPPSTTVSSPIATPPFTDGRPLSYVSATVPKYASLQDIIIKQIVSSSNFFDETFLFNDEILYDSIDLDLGVVRAINLRKVSFTLVPE